MDILSAAKLRIPVEYLYNEDSIFNLDLDIETLAQIYGEIDAHMIKYKETGKYQPSSLFIGESDFSSRYTSWDRRYLNILKKTLLNAKTIQESESRLLRSPKLVTGKYNVGRKFKRYTLKLHESIFDTKNFKEIFDSLKVSRENPIVYLRLDDSFLVKIINEPDFKEVNYTNIFEKTADKGLFIYSLLKGSDPKNIISYTVNQILISPIQDEIYFETSSEWREVLDEEVFFKISEKILRINFNFSIKYKGDISWAAFLYAINTSDFLGRWLFLFETTSAYILSDDNIEKFYIGFKYAIPQKEDAPSLGNFRIIREGSSFLIKASKVSSVKVLNLMYEYIPRLFRWFCDSQDYFINEMKLLVPDFVYHARELKDIPLTKYKALGGIFPDLFSKDSEVTRSTDVDGTKYGSVCQCKRQPVFIEEDEAEDVKNFKLENGELRPIRFFPPASADGLPENAKLFFCPMEDTPYPSMRSNVDPATLDRYPMIPHCVKIDNYDAMAKEYYSKSKDPLENVNFLFSGTQPISSKRLEKDSIGRIDDKINTFLNLAFDTYFDDINFVRLGVKNVSVNSILECLKLSTSKFQDLTLENLRREIFLEANAVQMHQTLWHLDREQIDEHLFEMSESNDPINSKIYLPLLEEIFDVVIYVVSDIGYEIPSAKGFFVKIPPRANQDCIILWKYSPDTIVGYPTYDIVVPMIEGVIPKPDSLSNIENYKDSIHKIHNYSTDFFGFKEKNGIWYKFGDCVFEISNEFIKKKGVKETAVTLDNFGKVAIRHVESPDGTRFSIRVPPSISSGSPEIIESTFPQPLDIIISVFDRPRSVSKNLAWYSYDLYSEEIGVMISEEVSSEQQTEIINYNLEKLIEKSKILKEVIDYLLLHVITEKDRLKLIESVAIDNSVNLFSIDTRYLPHTNSLDEAFNFLETVSPNFINKKILLKDFSIKSTIEYIKSYNIETNLENKSRFIQRRFDTKMDFNISHNTRLFQSQKELDSWNFSQNRQDFFKVESKLEPRNDVYVYYFESLYFIHPADSFQNARQISQKFLFPYEEELSDKVMLFEEIDGKMYRKKTEFNIESGSENGIFSQVLKYFNGKYAAVVEVFRSRI